MKLDLSNIADEVLENLFPGHPRPDETEWRTSENYKAPDHYIWQIDSYIERKSINSRLDLFKEISEIGIKQGSGGINAVGRVGIRSLINLMPDPQEAEKRIYGQIVKRIEGIIRATCDKVSETNKAHGFNRDIVLIICNNEIKDDYSCEPYIFEIGKRILDEKFPKEGKENISMIIFISNPLFTIMTEKSSWFNVLMNVNASESKYIKYREFALKIYLRMSIILGHQNNTDVEKAFIKPYYLDIR